MWGPRKGLEGGWGGEIVWSWGRHVSSEPASTFVKRSNRAGPSPASNVSLFLPTTHCWAGPCCCWPGWLGQPMEDVRSALTWLFWLADLCWPKGGGGWGTGPGSTSTLVRSSPRWQKELGLRSYQACVRVSALICSSCESLGTSPKTLRSLFPL